MALIDELKEMRENAKAEREEQEVLVMAHQDSADKLGAHISDLDRAIAALEPVLADEQPELFEDASVALEQLETDHALPPSADDVVVEEAPETVEELPALNEAMQDEREQGYAPVTNPEADFWAQTLTEQPKPEPFRLASIFRREKEEA